MSISNKSLVLQREIINVSNNKEINDFNEKLDEFTASLDKIPIEKVETEMSFERIITLLNIKNVDIDMLVKINNHINSYKNKIITEVKVYEY